MPNETRITVQINNGNVTLIEARRPTEAEAARLAEWYRPRCLMGVNGGEYIKLPFLRTADVTHAIGRVKSDGSFLGCDNIAYIVTADERAVLIALNSARESQAKADAPRRAAELAAYEEHTRRMERVMSEGSY